jgi:hypothetical protein
MKHLIALLVMVGSALVLTACEGEKPASSSTRSAIQHTDISTSSQIAGNKKWDHQTINALVIEAREIATKAKSEGKTDLADLLFESRKEALEAWQASQIEAGAINEEATEKFAILQAKLTVTKAQLAAL